MLRVNQGFFGVISQSAKTSRGSRFDGSVIRVPKEVPQPITFRGTILPGQGCTFIDDGKDRYLIDGDFPAGTELQVTGILAGSRIIPEGVVPVEISTVDLLARIHKIREGPEP